MPRCFSRSPLSFVILLLCCLLAVAILIAVPLNEARAQNHIDVIAPENSASENTASEKNSSDSKKSAQEDAGSENGSAKSAATQAPIKRQLYFFSDSGLTNGANLLKREKYTAALQVFQDILKRNPRNIDAVAGLGAAYLGMDQTKAAGDQIRKALARDNKHIGANYLLGRYYLTIDRPSQATEQLNALYLLCGKQNCPEEAALEAEIDAARRK